MSFDTREIYSNTSEYIRESQRIPELSQSEIQAILAPGRAVTKLVRQRDGTWQLLVDGKLFEQGTLHACTDAFRRFKGIA